MATFNFDLVGSDFQRVDSARSDKLYSLDGIQFFPPPEEVKYDNNYRISIKQTAAGQFADKGGIGGVEINVAGKLEWKKAAWLKALREGIFRNSTDEAAMIWYDPVDKVSYECICKSDSFTFNTNEHGFYVYRFKLWGQVFGAEWASLRQVEVTGGKAASFNLASLGWIANDVALSTVAYEDAIKQQADAAASGTGNEQPTDLDSAFGDAAAPYDPLESNPEAN